LLCALNNASRPDSKTGKALSIKKSLSLLFLNVGFSSSKVLSALFVVIITESKD